MKTHTACCLITVVVSTVAACESCQESPLSVVAAAPEGLASEVTATQALADSGGPVAEIAANAPDVPTGPPPVDSSVSDASPDTDSLDAAADTTAATDPICADSLPEPGQPCSTNGAQRCTNVGAFSKLLNFKMCWRPNSVICLVDPATGQLTWQLKPCPTSETACAFYGYVCMEAQSGAKCVVKGLNAQIGGEEPVAPAVCGANEGAKLCHGRAVAQCLKFTAVAAPAAAWINKVLGKCAALLPNDVPYLFPIDNCNDPPVIECMNKATADKPAIAVPFLRKCILDPESKEPRCAETCKDLGIIEGSFP